MCENHCERFIQLAHLEKKEEENILLVLRLFGSVLLRYLLGPL